MVKHIARASLGPDPARQPDRRQGAARGVLGEHPHVQAEARRGGGARQRVQPGRRDRSRVRAICGAAALVAAGALLGIVGLCGHRAWQPGVRPQPAVATSPGAASSGPATQAERSHPALPGICSTPRICVDNHPSRRRRKAPPTRVEASPLHPCGRERGWGGCDRTGKRG